MRCMWEHINWLHGNYPIVAVEHLEVACLCGWITAYIDNTVGGSAQDGLYHIRMHTGTRRVGNDDVGSSVFADELIIKHILHVTGEEQGVVDAIDLGIHFASSMASGTYSMPITLRALRATKLAMVPVPV